MSGSRIKIAIFLSVCCCSPMSAQAAGIWNVPGNLGQFSGHGFGAGHHAPAVRAPRLRPPHVPRVTFDTSHLLQHHCRTNTYAVSYPVAPVGVGCYGGNCHMAPTMMPPQHVHVQPAPAQSILMQPILSRPQLDQTPPPAMIKEPVRPTTPSTFDPPPRPSVKEKLPSPGMPVAEPTAQRRQPVVWYFR